MCVVRTHWHYDLSWQQIDRTRGLGLFSWGLSTTSAGLVTIISLGSFLVTGLRIILVAGPRIILVAGLRIILVVHPEIRHQPVQAHAQQGVNLPKLGRANLVLVILKSEDGEWSL